MESHDAVECGSEAVFRLLINLQLFILYESCVYAGP
jgi:hypothetical protein